LARSPAHFPAPDVTVGQHGKPPPPTIAGELQEDVSLTAAVRDVPDVIGEEIPIRPRHNAVLVVRGAVFDSKRGC
jgi:hypothetical protein